MTSGEVASYEMLPITGACMALTSIQSMILNYDTMLIQPPGDR